MHERVDQQEVAHPQREHHEQKALQARPLRMRERLPFGLEELVEHHVSPSRSAVAAAGSSRSAAKRGAPAIPFAAVVLSKQVSCLNNVTIKKCAPDWLTTSKRPSVR